MSRGRGTRGPGKPRRGHPGPNVLVGGDEGVRHPQGGAGHQAAEHGGNLDSREFGVPQADIPGGKKHLVNPETHPDQALRKPPRPADLHKAHGVEPDDWEHYVTPPDEATHLPLAVKPVPVLDVLDAVPVYEVQAPGKKRVLRKLAAYNVNVPAAGSEPTRICNIDPNRVEIRMVNEDSTNDVRFSSDLEELLTTSAQGSGPAGNGALLYHATNSYTVIPTQDEIFAVSEASASCRVSVLITTEVEIA